MSPLARQVLPPLLVLGLVVVPIEPITILAWLVAFGAAVISIAHLVRLLGRRPFEKMRVIRPALTLVLFLAVAVYVRMLTLDEAQEADMFARTLAQGMQAACERERKCPAAPPGWTADDSGRSRTFVGRRRVDYTVVPERSTFRITVRHSLDWSRDIEGGVGKQIVDREVIR